MESYSHSYVGINSALIPEVQKGKKSKDASWATVFKLMNMHMQSEYDYGQAVVKTMRDYQELQNGHCNSATEHFLIQKSPVNIEISILRRMLDTQGVFFFKSSSFTEFQNIWPSYQGSVIDLGPPIEIPLNPCARGFATGNVNEAVQNALEHYALILKQRKAKTLEKLKNQCFTVTMTPDEIRRYDDTRATIMMNGGGVLPPLHETCLCDLHEEGRAQQPRDYEDFAIEQNLRKLEKQQAQEERDRKDAKQRIDNEKATTRMKVDIKLQKQRKRFEKFLAKNEFEEFQPINLSPTSDIEVFDFGEEIIKHEPEAIEGFTDGEQSPTILPLD
jgi:hypothetical protein